MKRRYLSVLLAVMMAFVSIPVGLYAEGEETEAPEAVVTEIVEETPAAPAPEAADEEEPAPAPAEEPAPAVEEPAPAEEEPAPAEEEEPVAEEEEPVAEEEEPVEEDEEPAAEDEEPAEDEEEEEPAEEDEAPAEFEITDGVLTKYNGTAANVTVPADVTVIGRSAFSGNRKLVTVTLPDSVETIEANAFANCEKLEKVILGAESALKTIGANAFANDTLLDTSFVTDEMEVADSAFAGIGETEEPVAEEPETEEPAAEEPVAEEPETEEPVAEEPVAEEPEVAEAGDPAVTAAPEAAAVAIGADVVINAATSNTSGTLTYQWQVSVNGETKWNNTALTGATTATLTFKATEARLAKYYRCKVTDANGSYFSNAVKVDVLPVTEATVTATPEKARVALGETAVINAEAQDTTGTVTYQWQVSVNGVDKWNNTALTGAKTATLSFQATEARLAKYYRCKVTDDNGEWFSNAVKIWPAMIITITADPVVVGDTAIIHVSVEGAVGDVTFQWKMSGTETGKGNNTSLPGNKTETLTFDTSGSFEARLDKWYHCDVTDSISTQSSSPLRVSKIIPPEITATANPTAVAIGATATITVAATGTVGEVTYQWQASSNGTSWNNSTLPGNKTETLTFQATEARLAKLYRCVVTDQNRGWPSNAVQILPAPEVVAIPESETVAIGATAVIHVTVSGLTGDLIYQWKAASTEDGKGNNSTLPGAKTDTLTFQATESRLAKWYHCEVSNDNGANWWPSNSVKITVPPFSATATAEKDFVEIGETVVMHVEVENAVGNVTYQWYVSSTGTGNWNPTGLTGNKTDTLSFAATVSRVAKYYCVEATDEAGAMATSNVLHVHLNPIITVTADKDKAADGETVTLTCAVTYGEGEPAYQWQKSSDGETWTDISGATASEYSFVADDETRAYSYRCTVTDDLDTWPSDPVIVEDSVVTIDNVVYAPLTDSTIAVVGYTGTATSLVIPTSVTIEGAVYQVTEIAARAFENKTSLQSISLPNAITKIGTRAFAGCTALSSMTAHD